MKCLLLNLLVFCLVIPSLGKSNDEPILTITEAKDVYGLNKIALLLKDHAGQYNLEYVLHSQNKFEALNSDLYYFDQDDDIRVYWLKVSVDNQLRHDFNSHFYFLTGLDSVTMYHLKSDGSIVASSASVLQQTAKRPTYLSQELALPAVLHPGLNVLYFKIVNSSSWSRQRGAILLNLAEDRSFTNYFLEYRHYHGIALGILIVMVVFHAFIYFFFRDRTYLLFLVNILITLLYLLMMKHYHEEISWLEPALPVLRYFHDPLATLLAMTALWFIQSFLNTKETDPIMHKLMNGTSVMLSLVVISMLSLQWLMLMNQANMVLGIITSLLIIIAAIRAIAKGNRLAWYILVGFMFVFMVPIMYILQYLGKFPFRSVASDYHYFSESFRSVIFAVGIVDRFYGIKKEGVRQELEKQRIEYEKELQIRSERELISRELHDNIGTQLTSLSLGMNRLINGQPVELTEMQDQTDMVISQLRDTIWAMDKQTIQVEDLGQKVRNLFWQMRNSDMQFQLDLPENLNSLPLQPIQAIAVFRIIQEAVQNAVKYSKASSLVVQMHTLPSGFEVRVVDKGIGFDIDSINGSDHYGIKNMRKRAGEIDARLTIESEMGKGTTVVLGVNL